MKTARLLPLLVAAALVAAVATPAVAGEVKHTAKLYKWVDKAGKVHYGDQVPPEYADQNKEQLNKDAQVVKKIDGVLTPAEQAAAEKKKQDDAAAATRTANDKVLLATYSSVPDLERARDQQLAALRSQINIASGTVANLENQIAGLEDTRGRAKDPKAIAQYDQQITAKRAEMTLNQRQVVARQDESKQVEARFTADIARFKALTGGKQ